MTTFDTRVPERSASPDVAAGVVSNGIHDPEADMTITDGGYPRIDEDELIGSDLDTDEVDGDADTTDADEDGFDEAESNTDDELVETSKSRDRPRPARAGSSKLTARGVRAIRAKAAQLEAAQPAHVQLLATLLGVREDTDELVAHIIGTSRITLAGLTELEAIVEVGSNPFDAMSRAMQHEAHAKPIWATLAALGLVEGNKPSRDAEASMAIARAAGSFTAAHQKTIDAVQALARKNG